MKSFKKDIIILSKIVKMRDTNKEDIKPVSASELPPEFKKFDKPFGLEQHEFNRIFIGYITQTCLLISYFYFIPFGIISPWFIVINGIYGYIGGLGITVGCHRYWTHKTFKANKALQVLMMLMQTISMQYPIFKWCRDHRVHHKYTDTDADPHSAKRGFWFSHITWLFLPKHPEVEDKLKIIDISDLARDPIVRFQSKYYWELFTVLFYILPMLVNQWASPELTLLQNFIIQHARYGTSLHFTFLVNSLAHMWGDKPYDKEISSSENALVSLLAVGEGWHNYHHTFPWDYKAAEFGYKINVSTMFIHFFAMIGWAYDLKTVSHKLLVDRINRTGDGSHPLFNHAHAHDKTPISKDEKHSETSLPTWGWGDKALSKDDVVITETLFTSKRRG
ncbi:unnamed protein product [Orchesella dallaii]|uniref:Fatty acid desaturase domain-containing protein n=1 Tax=Orchesella dallaii TaxID=48710 RepID=A0ABP1PLI6_9HEXA